MKAIGDVLRTYWRAQGSDVFTVLVSFIYWSALNTITAVSVTNYTPCTGSEEPCDEHRVRRCPSRHFLCRKVVSCASGKTHVVSESTTSHICLLLRCWCCLGNINLITIFSCRDPLRMRSSTQFDFLTRNKNSCKPATIINQLLNIVIKWREYSASYLRRVMRDPLRIHSSEECFAVFWVKIEILLFYNRI